MGSKEDSSSPNFLIFLKSKLPIIVKQTGLHTRETASCKVQRSVAGAYLQLQRVQLLRAFSLKLAPRCQEDQWTCSLGQMEGLCEMPRTKVILVKLKDAWLNHSVWRNCSERSHRVAHRQAWKLKFNMSLMMSRFLHQPDTYCHVYYLWWPFLRLCHFFLFRNYTFAILFDYCNKRANSFINDVSTITSCFTSLISF